MFLLKKNVTPVTQTFDKQGNTNLKQKQKNNLEEKNITNETKTFLSVDNTITSTMLIVRIKTTRQTPEY